MLNLSDRYPRVLVVNGSSFGERSASANMLTNLFKGWPTERIALVCDEENTTNPGGEVCNLIWQMRRSDVPTKKTVRKSIRRLKRRYLGDTSFGLPPGLTIDSDVRNFLFKNKLLSMANILADLVPFHPPPVFWNWVDEFKPDIIYSMLGNIRITGLACDIARHSEISIIPHFMDDWPAVYYRGWLNVIPRGVMLTCLHSVLKRSPVGLSIGSAMAAEYQQRYGIHFQVFTNCANISNEYPSSSSNSPGVPFKFVYIGGLYLNRWQSLLTIGQALLALRKEGYEAELVIHAPTNDIVRYKDVLLKIKSIRLGASLSQGQIISAMNDADVLVHVESFNPDVRKYTRLSLSSKIPQYMASGKAILAYGPSELASCRYIQDCKCGIIAGQDMSLLMEALRSLIINPQRRAELGQRGWKMARENHSSSVIRERFRSVLAEAAFSNRDRVDKYIK